MDVEEVEGGWLVVCTASDTVEFVSDGVGGVGGRRPSLGKAGGGAGSGDGEFSFPSALAVVPGLGLVVRGRSRVQVFATPDAIAMAAMSACRVAWMVAVARGTSLRRQQLAAKQSALVPGPHRGSAVAGGQPWAPVLRGHPARAVLTRRSGLVPPPHPLSVGVEVPLAPRTGWTQVDFDPRPMDY